MSKNRSAAGITNIVQYDANKNITFVSGSATLLTVSSSGALTTTSTITAQTLVVQTITSSVNFVTGSTKFGVISSNTHQFTGSMSVSGSTAYFAGNVGVGTTSPNIGGYGANSRLLTIQGTAGSYGILELTSNSANADGSAIGRLDFGSDGQAANYKAISSIASFLTGSTSTKFGADLRFYTRGDNAGSGDPSERMRITAAGSILAGSQTEYRTDLSNIRFSIFNSSSNPTLSITNTTNGVGQTASIYFGQMVNNGTDARPGGSIKSIAVGTYTGGVGTTYSADLAFYTSYQNSDTERMRITSAGNVAMSGGLTIGNITSQGAVVYIAGGVISAGAGVFPLKWNNSTGIVTYDTSTRLVKENIVDNPYGLNEILQLKPRKYFRLDDQREEIGFVADEVVNVIPELVPLVKKSVFTKNEEDEELIAGGVYYEKLTSVLVKAIQELKAEIDALKAQ